MTIRQRALWKRAPESEEASRFRKLKEFALARHDHAQELQCFAGEMAAKRHHEDWPRGPNAASYWLGLAYGALSGYGRLVGRPFLLWLISIVLFATLLLRWRAGPNLWECASSKEPAHFRALYVSITNALFFGLGKGQEIAAAQACLYGAAGAPPLGIVYLSLAQTTISAILLFLFFLAVRNHFKIK